MSVYVGDDGDRFNIETLNQYSNLESLILDYEKSVKDCRIYGMSNEDYQHRAAATQQLHSKSLKYLTLWFYAPYRNPIIGTDGLVNLKKLHLQSCEFDNEIFPSGLKHLDLGYSECVEEYEFKLPTSIESLKLHDELPPFALLKELNRLKFLKITPDSIFQFESILSFTKPTTGEESPIEHLIVKFSGFPRLSPLYDFESLSISHLTDLSTFEMRSEFQTYKLNSLPPSLSSLKLSLSVEAGLQYVQLTIYLKYPNHRIVKKGLINLG
ncbi:unnamed protein product [Ambrosiozyma monospora]|uniref:Unnamed protein product n=1 Tax=Ambrosiozyma monospora TaxID=43982 RepID=A0ACB5U783_AMBMO|nr:unnamed protein product [Ambrosiozyma monospora]